MSKGKPNVRRRNGSARTRLRARVAAEGAPCHLCGKAIDYTLPAGHPMAFELDEIVPVSRGGDPLDRANVAPAHRACNQARGARPIGNREGFGPGAPAGADDVDFYALPVSQEW